MSDEYIPKRAMSIHAHPDDQEFTIGGTLAKWARAGCEIISPRSVNLTALLNRLTRIRRSRVGSPLRVAGTAGSM